MSDLLRRIRRLEETLNSKQPRRIMVLFGNQHPCPCCGLEQVDKATPEDCPRCKLAQGPSGGLDDPTP